MLLDTLQNPKVRSTAEDTTYLHHIAWRYQASTRLEAPSLMARSEGVIQATREKNVITIPTQLWTLRVTVMTGLARRAYWYNCGMCVIGVTKHIMICFETCSPRWMKTIHSTVYWDQESMANQVIDHRGEPTVIILLNWHSIKPTPNDLSL